MHVHFSFVCHDIIVRSVGFSHALVCGPISDSVMDMVVFVVGSCW